MAIGDCRFARCGHDCNQFVSLFEQRRVPFQFVMVRLDNQFQPKERLIGFLFH
jgi:hypothetical protein